MLVLGILRAPEGHIWHRSSVKEVIFEIPSELTLSSQILSIIPQVPVACTPREIQEALDGMQNSTPVQKHTYCIGKTSAGQSNLDPFTWSDLVFQRAARYLYFYQHNLLEHKDPLRASADPPFSAAINGLPAQDCLHSILDAIRLVSDDEDPSWEAFTVFWKFIGSETERFSDNCFLDVAWSDDLPGFRSLVFGQFLQSSRDFVTNSVRLEQDRRAVGDLKRYAPRKVWEQQNLSYIITQHDYFAFFNLRIAARGQLAQAGEIALSEALYTALRDCQVEMNPNYSGRQRPLLLKDLGGILNVPTELLTDPDPSYILTLDNIKKMMAIHLRLRADLPVVIQGETGCGKTMLVRYLVSFTKSAFKNMRVHGGTSAEEIRQFVREAEQVSKATGQGVVLFFDEINCAQHMDLFKEVVCDRRLDGQALHHKLKIIAACNPYQKLPKLAIDKQEAMGLGFRSHDLDTLDGIPLRHLVYRVSKLPDTMLHHIWDFGALTEKVEGMYIESIVNSESSLKANSIEARCLAGLIQASQSFMRSLGDESSFVSMRDYRERAIPIFKFFTSFLDRASSDIKALTTAVSSKLSTLTSFPDMSNCLRSILLALYVSYESRLSDQPRRAKFRLNLACELISSHALILGSGKQMTAEDLASQMESDVIFMQDLFMCEMKLPEGIAYCSMLKENVMIMAICIELNIPLFLVGKPGTSKSLAKKLVSEAMKGNRSSSRLFRYLKCVTLFSYQCSPHSTSEDILSIWDKAVRFLDRKDKQTFTAVVVLDEIGLAEDSTLMPLKVLHPLLEHPGIGFVGLSNWAIDPAKMNRGVFLSRSDPSKDDLLRTARGIAHDVPQIHSQLNFLTDLYIHIYENYQPKRDFYGLRDFFSMIKMLRVAAKYEKRSVSFQLLHEIVQRNFGGSDKSELILETFAQKVGAAETIVRAVNPLILISKCLERVPGANISGRYLLVQTQNPDAALEILCSHALLDKGEVDVISGSSFPKDRGFGVICGHLRKVRLCMATDRTLVCKDLEACLEALYDLFNQFFTQILGKRWVDIGLGNERMQCPVGDRFRVIILAKENQVASFPIPLLNRLEKHRLQIEDTLDSGGLRVVADLKQKLMAWQNKSALVGKAKDRIESDLSISLPGYYSDTIPSLVACSRSANDGLEQISLLLLTATPEFILSSNDDGIRQLYFEQQKHSSLEHYLQSSVGASTCPSDSLRAVVTTYDTLPSQGAIKGQVVGVCAEVGIVEVRHLEDFQTQMAFDFALCDYRKKCIEQRHNFFILVISTIASGNNNGGIIHQALRMLDSLSSCNDKMKSHTIVLLKLLRSQPQERRFHAIFDRTWKRVYIDSIVPIWSSPSPSIWDFWQAGHLSALLLQKRTVSRSLLCEVLEANLHHAVARLATMKTQSSWQPLMHIWTLQQMISHKQFTPAVESRILQILTNRESRAQRPNAWIENLCQNHRACLSVVGTLSRAIKHHIENQIVSILTALLACCACDGGFEILDSIVADTDDLWVQEKRSIWIAVVSAGTESNQPFMDIPTPTENGFQTWWAFSRTVRANHSLLNFHSAGPFMAFSKEW